MLTTIITQTLSEKRELSFPLIAKFHTDGTIVLFTSPTEGTHLVIGNPPIINIINCYCNIGEYSKDMTDINAKNVAGGYQWEILDNITINFNY